MISYAEAKVRIPTKNKEEAKVLAYAYNYAHGAQVSRGITSKRLRRLAMKDEFNRTLQETWLITKPVGNPVVVWLFWMVVRSIVWQVVQLMWGELDSKQEGE